MGRLRTRTQQRAAPPVPGVRRLVIALCLLFSACERSTVPAEIGDREFWNLIDTLSEAPGTFSISENLVSNEPHFAESVRVLRPGEGVFIGVGPEQNFSYIARLRPSMAFIVDIRRENRNLHLMYKALFELSTDRSDFVSRLFSRPRPDTRGTSARVDDIFGRYEGIAASHELFATNTALVKERLVATHGFPLSEDDLRDIDRAFTAFFEDGPEIHFWGSRNDDSAGPSYRRLMTARDVRGQARSFLADDDAFRAVKGLQDRNLIVPVIGDFAGATAIRRVGNYVRERADVVRAFYSSNVSVYLTNEQERTFCGNLSTLPIAPRAVFIDSNAVRPFDQKLAACAAGKR